MSGNTTPVCLPLSFEVSRGFVAAFLVGSGKELALTIPSSCATLLVSRVAPVVGVAIPTPAMTAPAVPESRSSRLCSRKDLGVRRRGLFMPLMPLESEGDVSTEVSLPSAGLSLPSRVSFGVMRSSSMAFISSFRPR